MSASGSSCNNLTTIAAAEGTPCGLNKVCSQGSCIDLNLKIEEQQKEEHEEENKEKQIQLNIVKTTKCLFGDGVIRKDSELAKLEAMSDELMTCGAFMSLVAKRDDQMPFVYCSDPKFRDTCCETCQIYDKFICLDILPDECSKVATRERCSSSMFKLSNEIPINVACSRSCGTCFEPKLRCLAGLCHNDAECVDIEESSDNTLIGFKCKCKPGYFGQFCELSKSI